LHIVWGLCICQQRGDLTKIVNATDIHLRESINHLKEDNNELSTKYNKLKEFVSIAAHELRSPIMPILGTLELRRQIKKRLH
jgi:signal transduction histidine kinase